MDLGTRIVQPCWTQPQRTGGGGGLNTLHQRARVAWPKFLCVRVIPLRPLNGHQVVLGKLSSAIVLARSGQFILCYVIYYIK